MLAKIKNQLAQAIAGALEMLGQSIEIQEKDFIAPPKPEMGDLSFPCFALAKSMGKSPVEIAKELAGALHLPHGIVSAEAAGPYLNIRFAKDEFVASMISEIRNAGDIYGHQPKSSTRIMVEYASPNTHKEIHVGHLRNFTLGLSVIKILEAAGYDVAKSSYMGDIGAHVAKCLWAYKKFHASEEIPAKERGRFLGKIYAEATRLIDDNPHYKDEVAEVLRKLEARDPEWNALWEETRQWGIDELKGIMAELGMPVEKMYFESEVEEEGKKLAHELVAKGIGQVGEGGALIVNLEDENLGVFLILKSDGSALYSTKELALAGRKFQDFANISESIHVVDNRQSLYFKQLFATLKKMGFDKKMVHLAYDFVTLKEGAMSSRKGNIISYEDFRDEMVEKVTREITQRHTGHSEYPDWSEEKIRSTAWIIADGAMKFGMLKQDNDKPIVFDMDSAISFDGFTGPYVQYAYARLSSVLAKAEKGIVPTEAPESATDQAQAEFALARKLADFPEQVQFAASHTAPSQIARYTFELAQDINGFYRDVPILTAPESDKLRRLELAAAARTTLENALALLGIRAPQEM